MNPEAFRMNARVIADELIDLLCRKQEDYGPGNINAFGEKGVVVRMNDKMERLKRLVWEAREPKNEAIADSYADIANYAIIALMIRKGVWPTNAQWGDDDVRKPYCGVAHKPVVIVDER